MPLICVCSPKGGVGKTMVAANLAYALARSGNKVIAIDFDVQNSLRLHFGMPISDGRGYVADAIELSDWSQFILKAGANTFLLPYGEVNETQRITFEHYLLNDPLFLQRGLKNIISHPELIVIADLPPGPTAVLKAMQPLADLHIVVMLADCASVSLLPHVQDHRFLGMPLNSKKGEYYVINQSDIRRTLNRDVTQFMEQRLHNQLLGIIHRDESVSEANASQRSVIDFSPLSAAAFDIEQVSKKVTNILNITIGHHAQATTSIQGFD